MRFPVQLRGTLSDGDRRDVAEGPPRRSVGPRRAGGRASQGENDDVAPLAHAGHCRLLAQLGGVYRVIHPTPDPRGLQGALTPALSRGAGEGGVTRVLRVNRQPRTRGAERWAWLERIDGAGPWRRLLLQGAGPGRGGGRDRKSVV